MWTVTAQEVCSEGKHMVSYGISGESVEINDISTRKDEIREFVELLNKLGASEVHAYDFVEDFLGK